MSIEAIGSATPTVRHTAKDLAEQTGGDETFIRDKIGVSQRYVLGPGETGLSLANSATANLFDKCSLKAANVDLLVFVTQNPDRRIPNNAAQLAARIEVPTTCASFDISLGCSGFVYGLSIVESFLAAQEMENAILVTCDPYSRIIAAEDKATNAVFGDAAAACWISRGGGKCRLMGMDFGTDGDGGDAIRIDAGGAASPLVSVDLTKGVAFHERSELCLHMDGRDVFNFVNTRIPKSIESSLISAKMNLEEIDWFALHQGSAYMLKTLARRVNIPDEKLLINIDRYGNTVSSTIPLLLEALMDEKDLTGNHVLISGFGVGLSWATGILEFKH